MPRRRRAIAPLKAEDIYREQFENIAGAISGIRQTGPSDVQAEEMRYSFSPFPWQVMVNFPGYHRDATVEDNWIYYHPGSEATATRPAVEEGWKKIQDGAYFHAKVTADPDRYPEPVVGDGEFAFFIPEDCDGMYLWRVEMGLSTAPGGDTTVQLRKEPAGSNMLSTPITVDGGTKHSDDSATPYAINVGNSQVSFKDWIYIDITAASGGRGLTVYTFWR